MSDQRPTQAIVVPGGKRDPNQEDELLSLFNPDGTPIELGSGGGSAILRNYIAADETIGNDAPYGFLTTEDRLEFTLEEESLVRFYASLQAKNPPANSHIGLFLDDVQVKADDGQDLQVVTSASAFTPYALLPGSNHMLGGSGVAPGGGLARILAAGIYELQLKFYGNFGHAKERTLMVETVGSVA